MSDTENTTTGGNGMAAADVDFLIACLKNTTGGSISIDTQAVADAKGYKNPRSVANRIASLKKKYDLPFGSSGGSPKKASDAAGPNEPAVPLTPSKQRVTKPRATPKKGTPKATPKGKKGTKKAVDVEMDDEEELAVKSPNNSDNDEAVFGKMESDDEAGSGQEV